MATIKGQNLRLFLDGKAVAFATSCTVHVSTTLEDSSTKDDTNDWQQQTVTGRAWDISVDALYSVRGNDSGGSADTTGASGNDALDMTIAGREVVVRFAPAYGEMNRVADTADDYYEGQAIVNDISVNAPNRQNASYTLQAQGNGPLEKKGGE